jgi:hypothetical protein
MESNNCIVCLEDCINNNEMCKCVYYIHNECLRRWRINKNKCLICDVPYPPLSFLMKIYSLYYKIEMKNIITVRTLYYCIYICVLIKLFIISFHLFFYFFAFELFIDFFY